MSLFLQFHTLTSYPSALLNRDDAGFAKRLPFGGKVRTRISSQCLKRHWRTFEGEGGLDDLEVPPSIRSRLTFQQQIVDPLVASGLDEDIVRATTAAFMREVLGESAKAKAKRKDDEEHEALKTGQITVLGEPEVAYLKRHVQQVARDAEDDKAAVAAVKKLVKDKEFRANLKTLGHAAGLSAALFGRMVTSDMLARGDAAVHVAHAFTVHEQESEADYFSAVDDLLADTDELGSGHIGSTELTSGLYYGYVVVDVPLLVSNLTGCDRRSWEDEDRTLAGQVVQRLVQVITTVSPGAKLGSTAPYAYAQVAMVEAGHHQPRTLANAFQRAVAGHDLLADATEALLDQVQRHDEVYPFEHRRALVGLQLPDDARQRVSAEGAVHSIPDLGRWASRAVVS